MTTGDLEVDLLGEPRVKNGLTYYPGVQTAKGSVLLGNVVRLQLQAEGAQPYVGYGFLKGLWLWRDQPYIRVQYMAPSRTDLPLDAIAYRQEPEGAEMPELMVTNRVGDLHLKSLLEPVFIEGGPLLLQLFQENVGSDADGFVCDGVLLESLFRKAKVPDPTSLVHPMPRGGERKVFENTLHLDWLMDSISFCEARDEDGVTVSGSCSGLPSASLATLHTPVPTRTSRVRRCRSALKCTVVPSTRPRNSPSTSAAPRVGEPLLADSSS